MMAETLLDLLDLYTHHRTSTLVGPLYSLEKFINIRITLNQEASAANIPRYALYASEKSPHATNGTNSKPRNGVEPPSPLTPATPGTISPGTAAPTSAIGIRGQNGTVRFMLDAARARNEKATVEKYHKTEEEEYEVEVEVEAGAGADRRRVR
jgi:CTD kinase subunit beta